MATYIVAVSGGIDSVVLLHMLWQLQTHRLIVAHVDHGIREESSQDAAFVQALAELYGIDFKISTHTLGPDASEERARTIRYDFLRSLAKRYDAQIITAHHADDVVESIAINMHRGTGWRGLATHDSDVVRPLTEVSKQKLYEYAYKHGLEWREDHTNLSDKYLRNRFRKTLRSIQPDERQNLLTLRQQQIRLKQDILNEVRRVVGEGPDFSRHFFTHIPKQAAIECLREVTKGDLTRPQLERFLLAIKTIGSGKTLQLGNGIRAHFTTRNFSLSLIK